MDRAPMAGFQSKGAGPLTSGSQIRETVQIDSARGKKHAIGSSMPGWDWASVGFDVNRKLWFIYLFHHGLIVRKLSANAIHLISGCGVQYQWLNRGPRSFWHVRERLSSAEVKSIRYDDSGDLILESGRNEVADVTIPEDYSYLCYAFSLNTSRGFVEFYDGRDQLLQTIAEKWLVIEDLTRRTVGTYPHIRFRVERQDIRRAFVSTTAVILIG